LSLTPTDQWLYQWRLIRQTDSSAELCLTMTDFNQGVSNITDKDCFQLDGDGTILKARTIHRAQCCRLPESVRIYE